MAHFNVLKGAYPSLKQLDKTLPLGTGRSSIVRGSAMRIDPATNKFVPTAADVASQGAAGVPGPVIYFSLQNAGDPDVVMANGITGIPCTMPNEVETDQYDTGASISVGSFLMAGADGKVTLHTTGKTAIGLVTKAAYSRWSNNAVAVEGVKTGNRISVIAFLTIYAPDMAV